MRTSDYYTKANGDYVSVRKARLLSSVQERRARKLAPYVTPTDRVLDFGCGNGGILSRLTCSERFGVEVLPEFQIMARESGIKVQSDISEISDASVDVVLSHHALEHVPNPFSVFEQFSRVLVPGGRIIVYVPAEAPRQARFSRWVPNEPNQHLFSWTPLSLGNLITLAGLTVTSSQTVPIIGSTRLDESVGPSWMYQILGHLLAKKRNRYEVVVEARKDV